MFHYKSISFIGFIHNRIKHGIRGGTRIDRNTTNFDWSRFICKAYYTDDLFTLAIAHNIPCWLRAKRQAHILLLLCSYYIFAFVGTILDMSWEQLQHTCCNEAQIYIFIEYVIYMYGMYVCSSLAFGLPCNATHQMPKWPLVCSLLLLMVKFLLIFVGSGGNLFALGMLWAKDCALHWTSSI